MRASGGDGLRSMSGSTIPSSTGPVAPGESDGRVQRGERTRAAIVARELGLLAVLGCQDATTVLAGVPTATLRCGGDGTGEVRPATIS